MSGPMKTDRRISGELGQAVLEDASINCGPTGSETVKNLDSKPDHYLDDLRLNNPWPELKRFVETIDLETPDPIVHKHIPYVVILVKIAEEWARTHSRNLPSTREDKKEFKDLVKSKMVSMDEDNYKEAIEAAFEVFAPRGISQEIREIINDTRAEVGSDSSDFWVMVAALKEFTSNEGDGEVPLEGSIPNMTSSTEHYINLQKIYQTKAEADCLSMEQRVKNILLKIGRDPSSISKSTIKSFCKNARKLKVSDYNNGETHPDVAVRTLPVPTSSTDSSRDAIYYPGDSPKYPVPTNSTDSSRDATYHRGDSPKYPPTSFAPYVPSSLPTPRGPYVYNAAGTCFTCRATKTHYEWCPNRHVPYALLPTRQPPQYMGPMGPSRPFQSPLLTHNPARESGQPSGRFCTNCGAHRRHWQMGPGK